jgi:hypothetical protein
VLLRREQEMGLTRPRFGSRLLRTVAAVIRAVGALVLALRHAVGRHVRHLEQRVAQGLLCLLARGLQRGELLLERADLGH